MKDNIEQIRDGWYGNALMCIDGKGDNHPPERTKPVNCKGIVNKSIATANTKFIPLCESFHGTFGKLLC